MNKLINIIKNFCKSNASKNEIDFSIFKSPEYLHSKLNLNLTLNQFKGDLMEILLEELFLGNGYIVNRLGEGGKDGGCDVLIRYLQDNSIRFVLQAKNWNKAIDEFDVKKEHLKFTKNYLKKFNLNNTHFCFVSWKYVRGLKNTLLNELNIKVWDEQDIINKLFKSYKPRHHRIPHILLEPYQEVAFRNILKYWEQHKRCYVEHATGTGKTYIIAKLAQELLSGANNNILILSPSTYINDRILRLLEERIPSKLITRTFKKEKKVHLLTYQYLMHNAEKLSLKGNFTHVIMDEVHRAGAPEWHNRGLRNVIDDKTRLVGLSATMQRYAEGIEVKSFLDYHCAGKLNLFEAMAKGILPVGDYVYSALDMKSKVDELKDEVEAKYDKAPKKRENLLNKLNAKAIKDYSIQEIIYKHYHTYKYRKIIAFCEDIEHTIDIGALLEKTFMKFSRIRNYKVHSKNTKSKNSLQLETFSNETPLQKEIFLLTAVDMLNEGIDVPEIDSVMLFRRTESPRIYLQQVGRCIRRHGIEKPLIFDCVLNFQSVNIQFKKEAEDEFNKYQKKLKEFRFEDIEVPKTIHIYDEIARISKIIEEVEKRLDFYPTYEEAKQVTQNLGIKNIEEYRTRYKEDPRLPSNPHLAYKDKGWVDFYDFFGKESPEFYPTYEEAQEAVQRLGIKSIPEFKYKKRYKEDPRLPNSPNLAYDNKGWVDWYDFLGTEEKDKNFYPTYEEAQEAVQRLGIKSIPEFKYKKRYKEDPRLPSSPQTVYINKGWVNWYDFLGTEPPDFYPTYEEAKQVTQNLGIKNIEEYRTRYKEDPRLPNSPYEVYRYKGWVDSFDFFGTEKKHFKKNYYSTYEEAQLAVQRLGIRTLNEYIKRYKEDPLLPSNLSSIYKKKGWIDSYNFFGTKRKHSKKIFYPTYEEAQEAVQKLEIRTMSDYQFRYKEDPLLPSNPNSIYNNKGWVSWYHFLGKKKK
jgi:superfamily II DNA or RNA helicase